MHHKSYTFCKHAGRHCSSGIDHASIRVGSVTPDPHRSDNRKQRWTFRITHHSGNPEYTRPASALTWYKVVVDRFLEYVRRQQALSQNVIVEGLLIEALF